MTNESDTFLAENRGDLEDFENISLSFYCVVLRPFTQLKNAYNNRTIIMGIKNFKKKKLTNKILYMYFDVRRDKR